MQIKIKSGMGIQGRMDSSNTGGKGISQAVAQNFEGPGVESLAVISGSTVYQKEMMSGCGSHMTC